MTYKFENYTTSVGVLTGEFTDPTVEADQNSISINDIDKTISVSIVLITESARVATRFENMPRDGQGWDDSNLDLMIATKLQEFAI